MAACAAKPAPRPIAAVQAPPARPLKLDTDGDGILDDDDQCPDEKENYNEIDDEDGCPERPHSRVLFVRTEDEERRVPGPGRPANCPVFRRVLNPAATLERWSFDFAGDERTRPFPLEERERVVRLIRTVDSVFELFAQPGTEDSPGAASEGLMRDRIEQVRNTLIGSGAPPSLLTVSRESSHGPAPGHGWVRLRARDRTRVKIDYFCYTPR